MLDRPTARITVTEDGCLMMINRMGACIFEKPRLAILENLARSHYLRWDAGFEKALDEAEDLELNWLASTESLYFSKEELVREIKDRNEWNIFEMPRGDILIYLPSLFESQEKQTS